MYVRHLSKHKHHKIFFLFIMILAAYFIFSLPTVQLAFEALGKYGYVGIFLAGMLYTFGFTTPIGVAMFLTLPIKNILLASSIGAIGGLIADMTLFKYVHASVRKEFQEIEHIKIIEKTERLIDREISAKIRNYLLFIFAGFIIASPLPDEFGVSLLAGFTSIKPKTLAILSFILHGVGIALLLLLGRVI